MMRGALGSFGAMQKMEPDGLRVNSGVPTVGSRNCSTRKRGRQPLCQIIQIIVLMSPDMVDVASLPRVLDEFPSVPHKLLQLEPRARQQEKTC